MHDMTEAKQIDSLSQHLLPRQNLRGDTASLLARLRREWATTLSQDHIMCDRRLPSYRKGDIMMHQDISSCQES